MWFLKIILILILAFTYYLDKNKREEKEIEDVANYIGLLAFIAFLAVGVIES